VADGRRVPHDGVRARAELARVPRRERCGRRRRRASRELWDAAASSTPTTNGRVIVAPLDSEGLFCFDMDGDVAMAAR
jgi:hypothetical protein